MNRAIKRCCVCDNNQTGEFIIIHNNKYHLSCLEKLQQENKQLMEQLKEQNTVINNMGETKYEENNN